VAILKKKLKKKVFLENDANLAALGESWIGAGKGEDVVLCLTLGTGVGGGLILGGKYSRVPGVSATISGISWWILTGPKPPTETAVS